MEKNETKLYNGDPKFTIRFRGSAMIPRLNQMAPCRLELTFDAITQILESLYRRPMFLEVYYIDNHDREWEITYSNYMKILPLSVPSPYHIQQFGQKKEPIDDNEYDIIQPAEETSNESNDMSTLNENESSTESVENYTSMDEFEEPDAVENTTNNQNIQPNNQMQYKHTKHRRK